MGIHKSIVTMSAAAGLAMILGSPVALAADHSMGFFVTSVGMVTVPILADLPEPMPIAPNWQPQQVPKAGPGEPIFQPGSRTNAVPQLVIGLARVPGIMPRVI